MNSKHIPNQSRAEMLEALNAALSYIQDDSRSERRRQANLISLSEAITKTEAGEIK